MFNTIFNNCFAILNTTNTVCLTFFLKGAGRRTYYPAEPSETETIYIYMVCGSDGGGAVRQRVHRPSLPLPDVPNRQPCVLRLVPKTTESSRVQQTPVHYCMLPKSWSAEHGHVDDQVCHQLLHAIEQGRLVEAARLDKCGGPLLVCVQLVAEAVPLSVDQNGAGGANERGPDPSACATSSAAAARMETAANGRVADMRMLL
jgi:hypothetical protein